MTRLEHKRENALRRKLRVRKKVVGSKERPRLSVHISHLNVTAQVVDDNASSTLAHATSVGRKNLNPNLTERAIWVGSEIAKRAKKAKVKRVVFDRKARLYHGRVKALADAARKEGLEF